MVDIESYSKLWKNIFIILIVSISNFTLWYVKGFHDHFLFVSNACQQNYNNSLFHFNDFSLNLNNSLRLPYLNLIDSDEFLSYRNDRLVKLNFPYHTSLLTSQSYPCQRCPYFGIQKATVFIRCLRC